MARAKQPKQIHQMTIVEWEKAFPDEDACCLYLAEHRWPEFVVCPRCGNPEVKPHGTMKWNWLCNACSPSGTNYRFSHITGTIFENTNKPMPVSRAEEDETVPPLMFAPIELVRAP